MPIARTAAAAGDGVSQRHQGQPEGLRNLPEDPASQVDSGDRRGINSLDCRPSTQGNYCEERWLNCLKLYYSLLYKYIVVPVITRSTSFQYVNNFTQAAY